MLFGTLVNRAGGVLRLSADHVRVLDGRGRPLPAAAATASAAPTVAAAGQQNAQVNAGAKVKKPDPQKVEQIRQSVSDDTACANSVPGFAPLDMRRASE